MDSETFNSVVASNFQRSYKVRAKNERDYLALPSSVKTFMASIAEGMKMPALPSAEKNLIGTTGKWADVYEED